MKNGDSVWVPRRSGGKTRATVGAISPDGEMVWVHWTESVPVGDLKDIAGKCVQHTVKQRKKWVHVGDLTPA